ncbi:nitrite reductase (NAD(P)H) small subunit [Crenobacter sp. SG2305]|uniref:Rieske (2Fe-2S) protein n=1 Tax=Crenobacter oryzisoli TaxID=3056844 RepID=UPI0025AA453B|nr:Rieske 2Fe-2S domain-containing protein [Crenobacter sp. SG2305]MDN0083799.1 nitrite reductase (NAD(P)H) small subunit [Crenobacter sp. SG2305]
MTYQDVCAQGHIAPGHSLAVRISGQDVALFNVNGVIHAIENACPHMGSALSGGCISGRTVACPAHGLRFDVTTGAHVSSPALTVPTFPVRIVDGRVLVSVAG